MAKIVHCWFSIVLVLSLSVLNGNAQVMLELDSIFRPPPTIPTNPSEMIYNAPEMDHMLEPVIVHVKYANGTLYTDPVAITATTILSANFNQNGNAGDTYSGTLCQHNKWTHRVNLCRYLSDNCIELVCDTTDPLFPLGKVEVTSSEGTAKFYRLLHTKYSGSDRRRLRFSATIDGDDVSLDSEEFDVQLQAAKIEISSTPAGNVEVNEPMSFTVRTMAEDPGNPGSYIVLTSGRHSALNIDATIVYDYKTFAPIAANFNRNQLLSSSITLGGTDVSQDGNLDLTSRKQCVNGVATFSDIRVLTAVENVQLNFTQTLPYFPWERWPPVYDNLTLYSSSYTTFVANTTSDAVVFTPEFDVSLQTMGSLIYEPTSYAEFVAEADANFRFRTPLKIQALDTNNRVITDGPDSMLNVSVSITPSHLCLSVDSDFALSMGEGEFQGSICEITSGEAQLQFSVISSGGTPYDTPLTSTIDVSGEIRVGALLNLNYDVNFVLFLDAAVTLINKGFWDSSFVEQGRSISCDYYWAMSPDNQETVKLYDQIHTRNMDTSQTPIHALVGSVADESTITLSTISKQHEMPIWGYNAKSGVLADKGVHPYFTRVSFGERAIYEAEGAFLASYHWNKVIVIKDSKNPLPPSMFTGFEANGVKVVKELTISALTSEPDDYSTLPGLDYLAEEIFSAGTRVIYLYTFPPTDIYLYREAIRLQFAPINGYIWMADFLIIQQFPFYNHKADCDIIVPTCTTAFNSTITILPSAVAAFSSELWSETLYDAVNRIDQLRFPSLTSRRWASQTGHLAVAGDALVALLKGAVKLIDTNRTISGASWTDIMSEVSFVGGSGQILFDENSERPGYSGVVHNFNTVRDNTFDVNEIVWVPAIWTVDPISGLIMEVQMNMRQFASNVTALFEASMAYPPIEYFNTRTVFGVAPGASAPSMISQTVPAAYWCSAGCGGGLSDDTNGTIYYYNHGTCEAQDHCVCDPKPGTTEPGYAGSSCQQILCDPQCRNGECTEPDVCTCEPYWSGDDCGIPLCNLHGCNNDTGSCTGPNFCTCLPGYYSSDCSQRCTCVNGICNDGQSGTGTCTTCDGGYAGANCNLSVPLVVVPTLIIVVIVVIAIVVLAIWYIKRMKFRAALANNDWIVDYNDVVIVADGAGAAASSMAFRSMVSLHADQQRQKEVIRNQGKWNSVDVSLKMLDKDSVNITTQLRLEIKAMRDIRHNNVVSFIGACCESPNVCILMETAPKGSLDDILSGGAALLDWNFKYSLLKDLCRGMVYISNSPFKAHGRLKSSNCVIDNRWTLKITDYGMNMFKANQNGVPKFNPALGKTTDESLEEGIPNSIKATLLYTAPEFLRMGISHPDHVGSGTIQGDMYSLGIIMGEILTHESPFHEYLDYIEVHELLEAIAGTRSVHSVLPKSWPQAQNIKELRPTIPEDTDPAFAKLMMTTWQEDPMARPTFQHVLKQLNSICPTQGDLMDNLVQILEKYSTNLESIVAERTAELAAEKQKTDDLVCRMLPRSIANQLLRGETVSAESFECVSIYFSDIVGFTKIAGASTPLQVVDLLNDLYMMFDSIIDHFDVYKVETIGDAYMVVSGLPIRNGDQHAGEIASMSLHLLSAILSFRIRHMPDKSLQLRIGIHSGPCVAGVVGLKMPRYCLFGDTVNTASRMESGGLALKIHMSDSTADILMKLGGYDIEKRGEREVKGKGVMTTYWLNNKDGFNRPLPTDDMAVSASQHEFK